VAQPADTVPPPSVTPPPAAAAAVPQSPTPDAKAAARRAACERYVAVLSGEKQDAALLDDKEVHTLAAGLPDLVTCGAVRSGSDLACKRLMPEEHGPGSMCRQMVDIFIDLREHPQSRSFLFGEIDWQECRRVASMRAFCDSLRQAVRSGDPKECAKTGDGESWCLAYMKLDPSLCRLQGKLATIEVLDEKENPPRKRKVKAELEEGCKTTIASRSFLAKGLPALAESGPPRERELAKAALHEPSACATYAASALQLCLGAVAAPAGSKPGQALAGSPPAMAEPPTSAAPGAPAPPAAASARTPGS